MNRLTIIIVVSVVVILVGLIFILQNNSKQLLSSLEIKTSCQNNADCEKYHACTEMICANKDKINEKVSLQRLKNCKYDPALYDPPGAFSICECVNNNCQFSAMLGEAEKLKVVGTIVKK